MQYVKLKRYIEYITGSSKKETKTQSRISNRKSVFTKSYIPNWTDDSFIIKEESVQKLGHTSKKIWTGT